MILEILKREMDKLGINYSFMRYVCDIPKYPYLIGKYSEISYSPEDHQTNGEIEIEGWSRNNLSELLDISKKLKRLFDEFSTVVGNYAIMINYENGEAIDSGEAELYKIVIRLSFKEWQNYEE